MTKGREHKTQFISHVTQCAVGSVNLQMLKGGKEPQARRSGSSAGCHSSPVLPRRPWTDLRCRGKDTERADSGRHLSVGQTSTAARALVKKIYSCNHIHSFSSRAAAFLKREFKSCCSLILKIYLIANLG